MIIESNKLSFDQPWRFGLTSRAEMPIIQQQASPDMEVLEIQGAEVRCLRSFHEEVAGDFFFASHYNCDPDAPLAYLDAAVKKKQIVIVWYEAEFMAEEEPDDWQAVLHMFRAAMATLHPQETYLRLLFPTNKYLFLRGALHEALADSAQTAGVGYDESHDWEAEALLHYEAR